MYLTTLYAPLNAIKHLGWSFTSLLHPTTKQIPKMNAYFCPHSMFSSEYLIEFVCVKSDLINNSDN